MPIGYSPRRAVRRDAIVYSTVPRYYYEERNATNTIPRYYYEESNNRTSPRYSGTYIERNIDRSNYLEIDTEGREYYVDEYGRKVYPGLKPNLLRGWRADEPKRGAEREQMMQDCDRSCFLLPDERKFPICTTDCHLDCRGIAAARIRGKHWGYTNVVAKAEELNNYYGCTAKAEREGHVPKILPTLRRSLRLSPRYQA